ncbi:YqaE/Pmp3 family membrane protein [Aeoliella sp.]|uniref:YqaE/Pmp3 family membrane protein n=1 Tax=Aeoliella sp. TaxID=2795800 RepID=UPI003CCBA179
MKVVKIVLSIFLPPVAAFMQVGLSTHFWINIVLTLLGGIPGVVHALWLVLADRTAASA